MNRTPFCLACLVFLWPVGAWADDAAHDLEVVTVAATRTERLVQDVPATVSVIGREQLDRRLVRDLKDLVRYEPGVSVGTGTGRFGIGDIRIRGLGGNRVRIETDGIAVSDGFEIGSYSNANRNFVDLDTLKRVEIVRGPASSLYGSDALGGVVAFVTRDPADYLQTGRDAYFGFKLGMESDWKGLFGGATAAFGDDRWSGMVAVSHRQGQETGNQGDVDSTGATRTVPNPQSRDGRSVLAKLVHNPDASQQFELTLEGNEDRIDTDVIHLRGFQPRTRAMTLSLLGEDHQARTRVSFAHEADLPGAAFADRVEWQVYHQRSETTQETFEEQVNARGAALRREREFDFDQRVAGVEAMAHKSFAIGVVEHDLTWGVEVARTDIAQMRDGRAIDHATGAVTNVVPPDVYPVRDFPPSRTTTAAVFVQDEILFDGGDFRLVPGLRVDHYALRPREDPVFAEDNPTLEPADITETNVSPKLGAVWHFADAWSLFGSYARGFRSPPYNDVNLGFSNLQFGYASIPNPDLRPETSHGFEVGVRHAGPVVHASIAGFLNRYDDFIESGVLVSAPPETPLRIFQARNVAEAEIRGIEFRAGIDLGGWREGLAGWTVNAAGAWQEGDNLVADEPLATVDPVRATLGIAYERARWGMELVGRLAEGKQRLADPSAFAPPGYGVLDLLAHWEVAPGAELDVGIFNLADRTYWDWADVGGLAADDPALDRYTRPGRSVAMSISVEW